MSPDHKARALAQEALDRAREESQETGQAIRDAQRRHSQAGHRLSAAILTCWKLYPRVRVFLTGNSVQISNHEMRVVKRTQDTLTLKLGYHNVPMTLTRVTQGRPRFTLGPSSNVYTVYEDELPQVLLDNPDATF